MKKMNWVFTGITAVVLMTLFLIQELWTVEALTGPVLAKAILKAVVGGALGGVIGGWVEGMVRSRRPGGLRNRMISPPDGWPIQLQRQASRILRSYPEGLHAQFPRWK